MDITSFILIMLMHTFPLLKPEHACDIAWSIPPIPPIDGPWGLRIAQRKTGTSPFRTASGVPKALGSRLYLQAVDARRPMKRMLNPMLQVGYRNLQTKKPIKKGELFSKENLCSMCLMQPFGTRPATPRVVEDFYGRTARLDLPEGSTVTQHACSTVEPTIKVGDKVSCLLRRGAISLTIPCRARELGAEGSTIQVEILRGKEIKGTMAVYTRGIVKGAHLVEIF